MVSLRINGLDVQVEEGSTLLEAIRFLGFDVPTLCYNEGLGPYGACRLCVVEIGAPPRGFMVTSCTYPAQEGLVVRTHSERVIRTRKMLVEMMVASCPNSKTIQDLASKLGVTRVRFKLEQDECIMCGLCVRMCKEQMGARALGFVDRGNGRRITTAFDIKSEVCRQCGACIYICPVCMMRCPGPTTGPDDALCNSCLNAEPVCLEKYEDVMCYLETCGWCVKDTDSRKVPEEDKEPNEV
jgi:bidirectional [NiFe] hydrogenase diaphorase subunit